MDDRADRSSGWPILVALGVAVGELGVLFGVTPVAVGGVLLSGGGSAALVAESGLADDPWRPLVVIGTIVGAISLGVWSLRVAEFSLSAFLARAATDDIAVRAAVVFVAALGLVSAGIVGSVVQSRGADLPGGT